MPQNINQKVKKAASVLADANRRFPSSSPARSIVPAKPLAVAAAKPAASGLGAELKARQDNVNDYIKNVPKMHKGGRIKTSGIYNLKKGEHVLTPEDTKAAAVLMKSGLKALGNSAKKVK